MHKLQTIHEVEGDTAVKETEEGLHTEREKNRALNTVFCSILRVCLCGGVGRVNKNKFTSLLVSLERNNRRCNQNLIQWLLLLFLENA